MSGLEPLAALGLACNILQIVDVGRQTITLIKTIYRDGAFDAALKENAEILKGIAEQVKTCTSKFAAEPPKREHQLFKSADNCFAAARDLQEEVMFLMGTAKRESLKSALEVAVKTNWRKRRLDRLKEGLDNAEKLMQTVLLERIWSNINAMQLELDGLGPDLRLFIAQWENNHRTTQELISREALITRQQASSETAKAHEELQLRFTHELSKSERNVKGHFSTELGKSTKQMHTTLRNMSLLTADATKRERLLRSLKYPGFNERRNQVREAHSETFRWIFSGDEDGSYKSTDMDWDSFSNWLRSTTAFYWISGKAGSGKTTLVKYILSDSQTRQYLDVWKSGATLISHFFWKPGSQMQRDLKGLLCSLIFQLLSNDQEILYLVLSDLPDCSLKDSDTDWSLAELWSVCLKIVDSYENPICVFLDGLDELDPQDTLSDLLDLLNQLSQSGKVKICVASRPESLIRRRLQSLPHLRLQDLTKGDLVLYANAHVRCPHPHDTREVDNLVHTLVYKAEGVFLWLVLAIKNVNRGLELDASSDIIQKRIDSLPRELASLYHDMWERATQHDPAYCRQRAALYLRITLTYQKLDFGFDKYKKPDVLAMLLCSDSMVDRVLGQEDEAILPELVPASVLLQGCKDIEKEVESYTAGLIEPVQDRRENLELSSWEGVDYDALFPFAGTEWHFGFIHRTAYDFLTDTVEGKEILDCNPLTTSTILVRICKAMLAKCRLFYTQEVNDDYTYYMVRFHNSVNSHLDFIHNLSHDRKKSKEWDQSEWDQLPLACERLCTARRLFAGFHSDCARLCIGHDFLSIASAYGFNILSLPNTQKLDLDLGKRSEILLNAFWGTTPWYPFVEPLLQQGVDPNWKGICLAPPYCSWAYLESPSTACLRLNLTEATKSYKARGPTPRLLKIALDLLSNGADLQAKIGFVLDCALVGKEQFIYLDSLSELDELLQNSNAVDSVVGIAFMPAYAVVDALSEHMSEFFPEHYEADIDKFVLSSKQVVQGSLDDDSYGLIFFHSDDVWKGHESMEYTELPSAGNPKGIIHELLEYCQIVTGYRRQEDDDFVITESLSSILQAAIGRSIKGDRPYLQRLEELGLATRVNDVRSMEEWLSQARKESVRGIS